MLQHRYRSVVDRRSLGQRMLAGGLAGLLASVPMGLAMIGMNRLLPRFKRRALPPKQITRRLARRAGAGDAVPPGQKWDLLTWLGHLGYGAAVAAPFPLVTRPLPLPGVLRGMLFALGVWAGSYMGWLPAMNILPNAAHFPARRNAIMIVSHLLWGALVGGLVGRMEFRENRQIELPVNEWA